MKKKVNNEKKYFPWPKRSVSIWESRTKSSLFSSLDIYLEIFRKQRKSLNDPKNDQDDREEIVQTTNKYAHTKRKLPNI